MEEELCDVKIVKENNKFIISIHSQFGDREYRSAVFEEVLDQMVQDLQEEFEEF